MTRAIILKRGAPQAPVNRKGKPASITYQPYLENWSEGVPRTGNGSRSNDLSSDTYLFLSPHLDDAALSCGGFMARLASAGERVIMATIFTDDIPEGAQVSWLARRNLRAWGLDETAFKTRQMEDQAAAEILGVETVHMGLLDAMYRMRGDGTPYYLWNTVGIPLDEEDKAITGRAIQNALVQIAKNCSDAGKLHVFTPICAGKHVDHILTRCSAEAAFTPDTLVYYEDHPYAAHPGVHIDPDGVGDSSMSRSWTLVHIGLTPQEVDTRIKAVACYSSQIPGLFPSRSERVVEVLSTRVPVFGKYLWDLHWRSFKLQNSRERMERTLRSYIARVGGENYWYLKQDEYSEAKHETFEAKY